MRCQQLEHAKTAVLVLAVIGCIILAFTLNKPEPIDPPAATVPCTVANSHAWGRWKDANQSTFWLGQPIMKRACDNCGLEQYTEVDKP